MGKPQTKVCLLPAFFFLEALEVVGNRAKGRISKKCSIFRKFIVLCFLATTVLKFTLLPYYQQSMILEVFRKINSVIFFLHKHKNDIKSKSNNKDFSDTILIGLNTHKS